MKYFAAILGKQKWIIIFLLFIPSIVSASQENNQDKVKTEQQDQHIQHKGDEVSESNHHTDTSPLLFVIIAIIIGALTRFGLQKSALPFTVALLIIGMGIGALGRMDILSSYHFGNIDLNFSFFDRSIDWAANIDPHILLYIFLPILIFEAAFAMDVHVFKKTFANATIMAVPGIIIAIVLSAVMVIGLNYLGLGLGKWNWPIALLFGAVISATDPVAVVSILKELGASKKLGTLIEGESLLNDGTAIVIFMVIFMSLTGNAIEGSPIIEFFRVSFGGIAIGLALGWIVIRWVKKVFNDMLVEITAIIGVAYLTFFIAEHFFHVSGVLALVSLGLVMASVGRTKISPEVQHFLHEFWELAAFVANTLIFLIVGVVIAERTVFTINDFIILGIIYIGVFAIRAIVISLFYPAMKKIGYGLAKTDAYVLWYGALRGAIGLALALIVAGSDSIDLEIRNQFLFLTAGIVTLTLLVNATTMKMVANKLGITKVAPEKALMIHNANAYVKQSTENNIERIKSDRFLKRAKWDTVREYLPKYSSESMEGSIPELSAIAESRRRILEKEKSSYWKQFTDGLLGPDAFRVLTDEINDILDDEGKVSLSAREDLEDMLNTPTFLSKAQSYPIIGKTAKRMFFERLTTSYDCAKGFVTAQEDTIKLLESMYRAANKTETKHLEIIENEINENKIKGRTFIRNLGKEYPEIYNAIATREAIRTMLNYEKHTVERLLKKGRLAGTEAEKMIKDVENRMKHLRDAPPVYEMASATELLHEIPWLRNLDSHTFGEISKMLESRVYPAGTTLLNEGKVEDGMFIIIRGNIKISINNELIDIYGPGNIVGELAALTGTKRTATVSTETPATTLWISSSNLIKITKESKDFKTKIWTVAATNYSLTLLKDIEPYNKMDNSNLRKELKKGKLVDVTKGKNIEIHNNFAILIDGSATFNNKIINAPGLLKNEKYVADIDSQVFMLD